MRNLIILTLLSTVITACGGGGGGPGGGVQSAPAPTGAAQTPVVSLFDAFAFRATHAENRAFVVSGMRDNSTATVQVPAVAISGNGTLVSDAAGPALLNGTPALKTTRNITGTMVAGTIVSPIDLSTTTYLDPTSFIVMARIDNGLTTVFASDPLPAAVRVGSTGSLGSGSAGGFTPTVSTLSYSVARDTSTSVLLTVLEAVSVAGVHVTDIRTVYRVRLNGSAELVSITTEHFNLGRLFETIVFTFT
jgi:hypothetical protein